MNEVNKVFQGLFQGTGAVADGLMERNRKNKLNELYTSSLDKLNQFLSPEPTIQETRTPQGGMVEQQIKQTPDVKGALNYLFEQAPNFTSSDEGKNQFNLLSKYIESNEPKEVKRDIREGNDGLWYDVSGDKPVLIGGEPKKEKTVYNQKFFESQTAETIKDLTPDQIKEGYFFLPKELQEQLYQNQDIKQYVDNVLNEGDFAPKLPGNYKKKPGSILPETSYKEESNIESFKGIAKTMEKINNNIELTTEEKNTFDKNIAILSSQYGLSPKDVQKVGSKIYNSNNPKEVSQVFNSLKKGEYSNDNSNISDNVLNQRRNAYENYVKDLDKAYQMEQSGQQPQGFFQQAKERFYNELEWDKDNGIITLKEYKYYHDLYR